MSSPVDAEAAGLEPGSKLGAYEVIARLNGGGMASLYLGRRTGAAGFAKPVAIKVVHPHLARNPQFVRMFVDEAKLSARIQHPQVVHVEELSSTDNTYYLVMEYVHGCSLAQVLSALARKKRRLIPELAVWLAARVAEGLHAAHETRDERGKLLGVVHRDVSPQNILIAESGHIKLIDFGIAKAMGRTYQTATGSLKGKLRYMAPEQARSSHVDRRTDVYALGIILWEMLTMRRLFRADNDIELLEKVRYPSIVAPSTHCDDVPAELDAAVLAALSKEPGDRPASALAFYRLLLDAMPVASRMDAERLAEVLRENLGTELAEKTRMLPQSITESLDLPSMSASPHFVRAPGKGKEAEAKQTSVIPLLRVARPQVARGQEGDAEVDHHDLTEGSDILSVPPQRVDEADGTELPTRGPGAQAGWRGVRRTAGAWFGPEHSVVHEGGAPLAGDALPDAWDPPPAGKRPVDPLSETLPAHMVDASSIAVHPLPASDSPASDEAEAWAPQDARAEDKPDGDMGDDGRRGDDAEASEDPLDQETHRVGSKRAARGKSGPHKPGAHEQPRTPQKTTSDGAPGETRGGASSAVLAAAGESVGRAERARADRGAPSSSFPSNKRRTRGARGRHASQEGLSAQHGARPRRSTALWLSLLGLFFVLLASGIAWWATGSQQGMYFNAHGLPAPQDEGLPRGTATPNGELPGDSNTPTSTLLLIDRIRLGVEERRQSEEDKHEAQEEDANGEDAGQKGARRKDNNDVSQKESNETQARGTQPDPRTSDGKGPGGARQPKLNKGTQRPGAGRLPRGKQGQGDRGDAQGGNGGIPTPEAQDIEASEASPPASIRRDPASIWPRAPALSNP